MKFSLALIVTAFGICLSTPQVHATSSSPYASSTAHIPLNQSASDNINGQLATSSHTPTSGSLASLTDASSSSSPTASVILGPDDATVNLRWDFGTAVDPSTRTLQTLSIWLAADAQRNGIQTSLSTSLDGQTFTLVENSLHEVIFNSVGTARGVVASDFHQVLYDFSGTNVSNFRFIQLDIAGLNPVPGSEVFQPPIVEVDILTAVPEPSTVALLALGAGVLGFGALRKNRKNVA